MATNSAPVFNSFVGIGLTDLGANEDVRAMRIQADGKIVLAGTYEATPGHGTSHNHSVMRFNTNGSFDTSFSGNGEISFPVRSAQDVATGVALRPEAPPSLQQRLGTRLHADRAFIVRSPCARAAATPHSRSPAPRTARRCERWAHRPP